jgi:hypothetical protein
MQAAHGYSEDQYVIAAKVLAIPLDQYASMAVLIPGTADSVLGQ